MKLKTSALLLMLTISNITTSNAATITQFPTPETKRYFHESQQFFNQYLGNYPLNRNRDE